MPPHNERVAKHALFVQLGHKCAQILLLLRRALYKVQRDGLHQTLYTQLTVHLHEGHEGALVGGPALYYVALARKEPAKKEVVLVVGRHV